MDTSSNSIQEDKNAAIGKGMEWYWHDSVGGLVLFRNDAHRTVVISGGGRGGHLVVRDQFGRLVPMEAHHPVAKQIAALPAMVAAIRAMYKAHGNCGCPAEQAAADLCEKAIKDAGLLMRPEEGR